jgi:PAS domain S-box-containing protein
MRLNADDRHIGHSLASNDFEALMAGAPDGVIVADEGGVIVYANSTVERLFGYEEGTLAGNVVEALIPEQLRSQHVANRQGYVASPGARPMGAGLELVGRRADGSEFPVDVSLSPTTLRGSMFITAFVRDITDRRRLEEQSRATEERFGLLVENVVDHALYVIDPGGRVASWNKGAQLLEGYSGDEIIGEPFARFYTDEDRALGLPQRAIEVASEEGRHHAEGWRVRKDGSRFRAEVSLTRLDDTRGRLRGFALVTRDVTDVHRLTAVADLMQTILAGTPTARVLELTSRYAAAIVDARAAWVIGQLDGSRHLGVLAAFGQGAAHLTGTIVTRDSPLAAAMVHGELVALNDLEAEAEGFDPEVTRGLGPALFVPLRHGDHVLGELVVVHRVGDQPFREDEIRLVNLFADQAALALHTSQLRDEVERLGLLEERERIARDLHDTVIQRLFATGMSLQALAPLAGSPQARARIEQSITDLDDTIRSIRTTIFDLQRIESAESQRGAREQVIDLASDASRGLGYEPRVEFSGPVDAVVDETVLAELLPTLREMLSNVARHAHAKRVEVLLSAGDEIVLSVTDDGVGIAGEVPTGGRGLLNMRERAGRLGGDVHFERPATGGTRVRWRVPSALRRT